jgi:predicted RNase H-like nuclease (RuvC/YqgF family)
VRADEELQGCAAKNAQLTQAVSQLNEQLAIIQRENEDLKSRLEQSSGDSALIEPHYVNEVENLKAALDKAMEENLTSKAQQSRAVEEKQQLQDQLAELQRKTEEQSSLVERLESELVEVQQQLEASRIA